MKRGSALILAIWTIAVLAVMVLAFSFEAHQQASINIYVQERNRVNRLIEPGKMLGEAIMLGFKDAKEWSEDEDPKDLDEEDRFYKEKRDLKFNRQCTIGPIVLNEEEDYENIATVTIDIQLANAGSANAININELYNGGDQQYALRWQMILAHSGIDEELEVEVKDADGRGTKRHNLMNHLIACWNDWRDEDDSVSKGPLSENEPEEDDGAEAAWYAEYDEEHEKEARSKKERDAAKEDRRTCRNGSIPDIKELGYVRGFRDFPSVLTGGYLYDNTDMADKYERGSEDNPMLKGIVSIFGTSGSSKIVITPETTVDQLMTIPGLFPEDLEDESAQEDSQILAQAIIDGLKVMPEEYDVDETRDWWPYKDFDDLNKRVEDIADTTAKIGNEAQQYIEWEVKETSVFKMTITAATPLMKRVVTCTCYVSDKKIRYMEWRED